MTRYITCSNEEFNFDFQAPVRIPEIEAPQKHLSSRLPRRKHNYTRWTKSQHRVPDKVGAYQVLPPLGGGAVYYAYWDGSSWSTMTTKLENLSPEKRNKFESPFASQFKTWRGLTTAAYLAAG